MLERALRKARFSCFSIELTAGEFTLKHQGVDGLKLLEYSEYSLLYSLLYCRASKALYNTHTRTIHLDLHFTKTTKLW
jgi:hypothetical protein